MIVFIDLDFKCHATNDGNMTAVESDFFDGKCAAFIEGYCYKAEGDTVSIYPWKPSDELDAAQRAYEKELIADLEGFARIILGGEAV